MRRISEVIGVIMALNPERVPGGSDPSGQEVGAGSFDVAAMLDQRAQDSAEGLDWRISVVDLLKLIGFDHSYEMRKEMAIELGYSKEEINARGSAELNLWLHARLMTQILKNGGQLPEGLPLPIAA